MATIASIFKGASTYFGLMLITLLISCNQDDDLTSVRLPYAFFAAGHTSGNPANWHRGFHAPFRERLSLIQNDSLIEFGFLLGDMVKKGSHENFKTLDAEIQTIGKPVYKVAGNHDVTDRGLYDQRYGPSFYSFRKERALFIVLDSNLDAWNISGDQLSFLQKTLADKGEVDHIFLMVHHLLWWSRQNKFRHVRINSSTGRADTINFFPEILPLLKAQHIPVYIFAGDVGAQATGSEYMYHHEDRITLIATGMGGAERDNFIITSIDDRGAVHFDLVALNGDDVDALGRLEDYVLPE